MIPVVKESLSEFKNSFSGLIAAAIPWIGAAMLLNILSYIFSGSVTGAFGYFLITIADIVVQGLIAFSALCFLYKRREVDIAISQRKVLSYLFAMVYIGIAASMGLVLFVIPGIVILAACFFAPVYILKDGQGPIESVASSATLLKGRVLHVTLLLLCIWAAIFISEYIIGFVFEYIPLPLVLREVFITFASIVISMITLPVMVNLKAFLEHEHNKSMRRTPAETAD